MPFDPQCSQSCAVVRSILAQELPEYPVLTPERRAELDQKAGAVLREFGPVLREQLGHDPRGFMRDPAASLAAFAEAETVKWVREWCVLGGGELGPSYPALLEFA